jgi:2-polyprenyl-3-methyl-5-hydroxy-6-metoxy-1,4-benzoquinol methylase
MPKYVLGHHLKGEGKRLGLMSELLDPMHRRYIEALKLVRPGARTLEVGCGNGSISAWLAQRVSPGGTAVACDLDLSLVNVQRPNLEFRQADIVAGPVGRGGFDLVTARAVLHHVGDVESAMNNLVASVRPGGALLLIEPDFLPVSISEPPEVRTFWDRWLAWSRERGIDYHIGRTLAPRLAALALTQISGTAETALYNGGSPWADYWMQTITELRDDLIDSGKLDESIVDAFLRYCADPSWWTQTIAFTAVHGWKP